MHRNDTHIILVVPRVSEESVQNDDSPLDITLDNSGAVASVRVVVDECEIAVLASGIRDLEESDFGASNGGKVGTDDVAGVLLSESQGHACEGEKREKPHREKRADETSVVKRRDAINECGGT